MKKLTALLLALCLLLSCAQADGADYVVLLAHLGNQAENGPYIYSEVIENTSGIDAMLDAHSHDTELTAVKNREGKDVLRASHLAFWSAMSYNK